MKESFAKAIMKPIDSLPLIQGEIADYRLSEEGILYSYSKNRPFVPLRISVVM